MRGVLLAGGTGSRLWPITRGISKQLVPVFDKPMIYYPLATLVMAGIQDIMVITTPEDQPQFRRLLGDGDHWGLRLVYEVQSQPRGIAEALLIAEEFLAGEAVALVLGDNIFHGARLGRQLQSHHRVQGGVVFGYPVADPRRYGVVEFSPDGRVRSIEEKPTRPQSRYAVPGMYFYDADAPRIAAGLPASERGEREITAVNQEYLRRGRLQVEVLDRGTAWFDTGTFASLAAASEYVRVIEERQGFKIGCVEEVAWREGLISDARLRELAEPLRASGYGEYLRQLLESPEMFDDVRTAGVEGPT